MSHIPKPTDDDTGISIVTAFFDIGRGKIGDDLPAYLKRTTDTYFNYFALLAKLENDMVIFTSAEFKDKILALRQGKKTTVIVFDFKNKFFYIKKRIAQIQNSPQFIKNIDPAQIKNIEYWSADYVLINNLKTYFVNQAIKQNLPMHDQVAWLDFGYVRDIDTLNQVSNWRYSFDKNKVHFFAINKDLLPIDSLEKVMRFIFNNQVLLIGGCIVAHKDTWQEFFNLLFASQKALMQKNIIDDDQGLYVFCLYQNPNLFEIHDLGKNNWFHLFKKYDVTAHQGFFAKLKRCFGYS